MAPGHQGQALNFKYLAESPTREEALWLAHATSAITVSQIGRELGLSTARVSLLIKRHQGKMGLEI